MLRSALILAALLAPVVAPAAARAELVPCQTSIRGEMLQFVYDPQNPALRENSTLRERLFGEKGAITCPGLVTLRALTPELDDAGRAAFCLQWDAGAKTYLGYAQGARDAWLSCRKPSRSFCQRVNGSATAAGQVLGNAAGFAGQVGARVLAAPGGAAIVQGQGEALGAKLAGLGAAALGNPATLGAVAVTAVAVGGAVYVCSDRGAEGAALAPAPAAALVNGAQIDAGAPPQLTDTPPAADLPTGNLPATSPGVAVPMLTLPPLTTPAPEAPAPETPAPAPGASGD